MFCLMFHFFATAICSRRWNLHRPTEPDCVGSIVANSELKGAIATEWKGLLEWYRMAFFCFCLFCLEYLIRVCLVAIFSKPRKKVTLREPHIHTHFPTKYKIKHDRFARICAHRDYSLAEWTEDNLFDTLTCFHCAYQLQGAKVHSHGGFSCVRPVHNVRLSPGVQVWAR